VGLSDVFGEIGVNKLYNIESDRGGEDSREDDFGVSDFK